MNALTCFVSLAVLSLATLSAGCAAPTDGPPADEAVEQTEEALTSCGAARYNQALAHYKNAVAWSKDRLARGVCESENGFQWGIADEASRAVMTCGEFRNVIKTSVWAQPIRTVLAPSLTLRSLTGELAVIKDSNWQNWSGVDRFFGAGLSFWAQGQGAYGPPVRIDFRANGKATWGELVHNEVTGDITWRTLPATYTITKSSGRDSGPRVVKVTRAGKTETFGLGVENPVEYGAAPIFVLHPFGTGSVLGEGTTVPKLYSLVGECDA